MEGTNKVINYISIFNRIGQNSKFNTIFGKIYSDLPGRPSLTVKFKSLIYRHSPLLSPPLRKVSARNSA